MAKTAKKSVKKSPKTVKKSVKTSARKTVKSAGKSGTPTIRPGTIRARLAEMLKKHGYEDAYKVALKAGINQHTARKQLWLLKNNRSQT